MGKYKQWLYHQDIGKRLRDQINTLEQERARVQKMAPAHPTSLPDVDNPIVAALLYYTRQGNKLSDIDPIKAAMPVLDSDRDRLRPATSTVTQAASPATASHANSFGRMESGADDAVVTSLLARAETMPEDPLDQMRELSRARDEGGRRAAAQAGNSDSVGQWWESQRADDSE